MPTVSLPLGGSLRPFLNDFFRNDSDAIRDGRKGQPASPTTPSAIQDLLDIGKANTATVPAGQGGFELAPDGTYQFSRTSLAASFDLSFSQATLEATSGEEGTNLLGSLTNLNLSVRVSAEFEQALIETGRARAGNPVADLGATARQVVDRFRAERIRASISIDLSFSAASLSLNAGEGGLSGLEGLDLDALAGDGTLGGFVTLLETLFGDDERFKEFIANLEKFLKGFGTTAETAAPVESAEAPPPLEGQSTGGPQSFSLKTTQVSASFEVSFESTTVEFSSGQASDPIVLDLDGDGIELTSALEGILFDLDADGAAERTATVTGGDAFLALDRNRNGAIDSGSELFGDQNGAANGFLELAKFDSNGDGVIDPKDTVFDLLRVFTGAGAPLSTLLDVGIQSIDLLFRDVSERAQGGNRIAQLGAFSRTDGTRGLAVDALLNRVV
ncbi:MAG: hypothetical protein GHCLOJNM_01181 [bacterium]|nr:hypothetical protein [bacterium]